MTTRGDEAVAAFLFSSASIYSSIARAFAHEALDWGFRDCYKALPAIESAALLTKTPVTVFTSIQGGHS
jgi:hypothetical protein